jgi:hypothetical protein
VPLLATGFYLRNVIKYITSSENLNPRNI